MTPAELNAVVLRALRRKSPMTEAELILLAGTVFGQECPPSTVRDRLRDLDDLGLVARESDPDGVLPASCSLTVKGQHKARQLG